MDWYKTVFEVIDMRSFSNLWYWIALAVVWSSAAHWVLGVPFDLIQRGARQGGQAEADLNDMVRINVNRILYISGMSGMWLLGLACFGLTTLAVLGFYYWIEFCQAVLLLAVPLTLVGGLSIHTAHRIARAGATGPQLHRMLRQHRQATQAIGMLSILVTSLWGMHQNLSIGALGG
ncbi:component of SufBCD complex [Actibacterium sp. D379-3]